MKIYALISHNLVLTQFWPKVVSWRFEKTTDEQAITEGPWVFAKPAVSKYGPSSQYGRKAK